MIVQKMNIFSHKDKVTKSFLKITKVKNIYLALEIKVGESSALLMMLT